MSDKDMLEAVKMGLKGELDSVTLYREAEERSEGEVAAFFSERAGEEQRHYNWLLRYYRDLTGGKIPDYDLAAEVFGMEKRSPIFSQAFLKRIAEATFLTAAVSAAALLEANAVKTYAAAAETLPKGPLRDFFQALSDWEKGHYDDLLKIQEESREYWFQVQNFEPF